MSNNIILNIIKQQEEQRQKQAELNEWGIYNRNKLVEILEAHGAKISDSLYNDLLFKINGLRINEYGRICYLSFYKPSKRILNLLNRYSNVIKEHFNEITRY